jgi:hypothetical protein
LAGVPAVCLLFRFAVFGREGSRLIVALISGALPRIRLQIFQRLGGQNVRIFFRPEQEKKTPREAPAQIQGTKNASSGIAVAVPFSKAAARGLRRPTGGKASEAEHGESVQDVAWRRLVVLNDGGAA